MNQFIRVFLFSWMMLSAVIVWVCCGILGFFLVFTNYSFLSVLTPIVGLTAAYCIITCAFYILLKSDPIQYMKSKYQKVRGFLGKAIQH